VNVESQSMCARFNLYSTVFVHKSMAVLLEEQPKIDDCSTK